MPNETCGKQLAGPDLCNLTAGHEGECGHNGEQSGATEMEIAHKQEGEWLNDFVQDPDYQA